ncbi:unnamed protein product [Rotaria sordida]|uniref:Uncharacterized protein n=1 Tax=Rotaria sordida TaxID=392033 RepID=A0A815TSI8_9BILA|nr:unnamed protein product [Rotaria sordida]CAF4242765.1 unnamed protein product [Rotaria sordida]
MKSSDPVEINIRTVYKKTCALASMSTQEVGKLWILIMDKFQDIENVKEACNYVTNTWMGDDATFDFSLWNYHDFKITRTYNHVEG